jgi:hypothetical protein
MMPVKSSTCRTTNTHTSTSMAVTDIAIYHALSKTPIPPTKHPPAVNPVQTGIPSQFQSDSHALPLSTLGLFLAYQPRSCR